MRRLVICILAVALCLALMVPAISAPRPAAESITSYAHTASWFYLDVGVPPDAEAGATTPIGNALIHPRFTCTASHMRLYECDAAAIQPTLFLTATQNQSSYK